MTKFNLEALSPEHQEIFQEIEALEEEIIAYRRDVHEHPELSFKEFKTTQKLVESICELGLEPKLYEPTGVSADLLGTALGAEDGPMILLRADMDALEVQENTGLEFSSKNDGVMHACGHDTHVAMLFGAMKALVAKRHLLRGRVRFMFQPAEEVARGAMAVVEQGALEGVDACYGSHIFATQKMGTFDIQAGPRYAAADICKVRFNGFASHGAMPHLGVDAAVMAAHFVTTIQSLVSRRIDPQHAAVVTVGRLCAGTRFNIVTGHAECDLTVRTFYPEDRELIKHALEAQAHSIAQMEGGSAEFEYTYGTQIVSNNEAMTKHVRKLIADGFGAEALVEVPATLGGEDFGMFSDKVPGTFVNIGGGFADEAQNFPNHN